MRISSLLLALLVWPGPAGAASFDCRKAQSPIEVVVCQDPNLSQADETMASTYQTILAKQNDAWRRHIIKKQREWLAYISRDYERYKNEANTEDKQKLLNEWLVLQYNLRTTSLREIGEREQITYVDRTNEAQEVCNKLLDKTKMTWEGRDDYGLDSFSFKIPEDLTLLGWSGSAFDFLNNGKNTYVYLVNEETTHFTYTWYIVAAHGEKEIIEERMGDREQNASLARELIVEYNPKSKRVGPFPTANISTHPHPTPKLASRLLDTSATELYGGWYTRSDLVRYKERIYVTAVSVNNGGGPTFAIFKPQAPGKLRPLCYYRATPSLVVETTKTFSNAYRCPVTQDRIKAKKDYIKTDLDASSCREVSARIDLKEWGGVRPVRQGGEQIGFALCGNNTINVGDIGADHVDMNTWKPISALENNHGRLYLTQYGPYLVMSHEAGDKYYRIVSNALEAVCAISRYTLAPPGYKNVTNAQD